MYDIARKEIPKYMKDFDLLNYKMIEKAIYNLDIYRFKKYEEEIKKTLEFCIIRNNIYGFKILLKLSDGIDMHYGNEYLFRLCSYYGNTKAMKLLIKKYPDTNIRAENEYAFRWATCKGNYETIVWLLNNKPDIDISIMNNWALKKAIKYKYQKIIGIILREQIKRKLKQQQFK